MGLGCSFPVGARQPLGRRVGGRERGFGAVLTSTCWEDILVSVLVEMPAGNRVWVGQGLRSDLSSSVPGPACCPSPLRGISSWCPMTPWAVMAPPWMSF